ncbi:prenyltransferase/squalene oxidase repeat-containing protein [Bremerella sp. JC770]|uniref:prenyltransferase/squalene oxidase repeat-containing protein n=1 Tax=Bremerella sp. JC770 TaxID=3232137 RepID=UPI00345B02E4
MLASTCLSGTRQVWSATDRDSARSPSARAAHWLIRQQHEDGGWHSQVYGNLRTGVGISALILKSLSYVRNGYLAADGEVIDAALIRGFRYLTQAQDTNGLVASPSGESDQPVYATCLLLDALQTSPLGNRHLGLARKLLASLQLAQFGPANGCPESAFEFGGFGPLAPEKGARRPGDSANLSVTSHALQTLRRYDQLSESIARRARIFLDRCQGWTDDPPKKLGFAFTPDPNSPLNKQGFLKLPDGSQAPRASPTATVDGILAMEATPGYSPEAIQQAFDEYQTMSRLPSPPTGKPPSDSGLAYYHLARLGELYKHPTNQTRLPRWQQLARRFIAAQHPDGHWINSINTMREDDPLIATALAIIGLTAAS